MSSILTEGSPVRPITVLGNMSIDHLNLPAAFPPTASGMSVSRFMNLIWLTRPDLQARFDLREARDRERFIAWYADAAPKEYHIPALIPVNGRVPVASSRLLYNMKSMADRASRFGKWLPLSMRRRMRRLWTGAGIKLAAASARQPESMTDNRITPEPGVNLVGYANGMLSLGEHLRMTAEAFRVVETDLSIIDYSNGARDRQQIADDWVDLTLVNRHIVNIFHINADQMLNAYCHFGHGFFQNRYNIGFWAWELERFPATWAPVAALLDEIWAPSRFVQAAIASATDKCVTLMPQCIEIPSFERRRRSHFGLREDRFLFIFTFDFLSYIDRKNPIGAIRAFREAFPNNEQKAGFVLKVMNGDEQDPRWHAMLSEIGGDERIKVINQRMSRAESLALVDCCDCFVSLHRSEGFGRGPAEAMLMGKPVIATGYSGNVDFTRPDNSFVVDYRLIPVLADQYVFGEGQVWAEPDIHHAAQHMRLVVTQRGESDAIARRGQAFVREHLSAPRIGDRMMARLHELALA